MKWSLFKNLLICPTCLLFLYLLTAFTHSALAGESSENQPISVVDNRGRTITLPAPAKRIISLAPHITEQLFEIGAGDRIIATVSYSDYPAAANDIPRVGGYNKINIEQILTLQPDLVIGWESGNNRESLLRLPELGIKLFISEPRTLQQVADNLKVFGKITGDQTTADIAAARYLAKLQQLKQKYQGKKPVSLFYEVWNNPLITLNGEHLFSRMLDICSGKNIFSTSPQLAPRVSREAIIVANPQVIITSNHGKLSIEQWQEIWNVWPQIDAVKNQQLYIAPPDVLQRASTRLVQGTEFLCETLQKSREQAAKK
ncbi:cobalamin-binding protein [Pelagibaculum spongiae]|uniref:Cobalamin-binding protein n=1 Tax=Pelagibaculum spongiae TaxID=2080658 RepID=A0A2V1GY81_9GAMM|nr:cobalamin-binding protein [Pelagibaculum spongiae]PVZ67624.1 cobalamin-binding protein [Pelagibaculum spongiae]